jgi:hypothetical protein
VLDTAIKMSALGTTYVYLKGFLYLIPYGPAQIYREESLKKLGVDP